MVPKLLAWMWFAAASTENSGSKKENTGSEMNMIKIHIGCLTCKLWQASESMLGRIWSQDCIGAKSILKHEDI